MFNKDNINKILYAVKNNFNDCNLLNGSVVIGLQKEITLDINNNIIYHDYFNNRNNVLIVGKSSEEPLLIIKRLLVMNKKYHLDLINQIDINGCRECNNYASAKESISI